MGWNSWDIFGTTITEQQAREQADAMAEKLLPSGYDVFTVDIQWYQPTARGHVYGEGAALTMDEYSRLLPAVERFPSAEGGNGFKPLADYVHDKGLRFGIHLMRGIPRQAVRQNTKIKGANVTAADIADTSSICSWNPDMYGVDMSKDGAQAYYDSLFEMYAAWGVDYVKVDDISRPYDDVQKAEIEAIRKAIDNSGRDIVLSLSPGATPLEAGEHVAGQANLWRISDDFWDRWPPLYDMFERLDNWTQYRQTGAWPDADMLPFGIIEFDRESNFTEDEARTCMTLWSIARSPLIFGGDMTRLDRFTTELLTNDEVLAVNQNSTNNRQLSREDDLIAWVADVPGSEDKYLALFNARSDSPYDRSEAAFESQTIDHGSSDMSVSVEADLGESRMIALAVDEAGEGIFWDHAAWVEPTLHGPAGEMKLTELEWTRATAGWGQTRVDRTCEDGPLRVDGQGVRGIGTHANSLIEYQIPEGYNRLTATAALLPQDGGTGSIRFLVLTAKPDYEPGQTSSVSVDFADLGISGSALVRDLWAGEEVGTFDGQFSADLPPHGAGLYRVSPE